MDYPVNSQDYMTLLIELKNKYVQKLFLLDDVGRKWDMAWVFATDYGHTMAKSLIFCDPNSNSNPNLK